MKLRFGTAALLCILLCFSGCRPANKPAVPPPLAETFQASVRITTKTLTIDADCTRSDGVTEMHLSSPAELCGMTVRVQGNGTISLDGIDAALPDDACFVQIAKAYDAVLHTTVQPTFTPHGWLYTVPSVDATVLQDADSGQPLRISLPDTGVIAVFTYPDDTPRTTAA